MNRRKLLPQLILLLCLIIISNYAVNNYLDCSIMPFRRMQEFRFRNLVFAQTKSVKLTGTPIPTDPIQKDSPVIKQTQETINKLKQIEQLKEKIATRVAQIRESEKGGYAGQVKKIDGNIVTVSDRRGDKNFTVTEDTIFYILKKNSKTESTFSNLKEGDFIALLGYFNESKESFSAKYVFIQENTTHLLGKITDNDKANFTIVVKAKEGLQTVDIETYTKITTYTNDKVAVKSGFSKLKIGDTVHIIGLPNTKESDRVSAARILVLPALESSTATPTAAVNPTKGTSATSTATPKTVK